MYVFSEGDGRFFALSKNRRHRKSFQNAVNRGESAAKLQECAAFCGFAKQILLL
jgi:hypothetical protein